MTTVTYLNNLLVPGPRKIRPEGQKFRLVKEDDEALQEAAINLPSQSNAAMKFRVNYFEDDLRFMEKINLTQNQIPYVMNSWKAFMRIKEPFDAWRKKKVILPDSPRLSEQSAYTLRNSLLDPPKIDYKFSLDADEGHGELETDPNEW